MGATPQHETAMAFWFVFLAMIFCMSVVFAVIGGIVGSSKGRRVEGVLLGLFLGVIGLILIAVMEPTPDDGASSTRRSADSTSDISRLAS